MKSKWVGIALAVVACLASVVPAEAAVPKLLTYQGVLKDGSGNFLTGTYSIVFRLYSASSGGAALWTETQSSVATSSGKFSVQLGSVTTLNLDFNSDYWLSIQVGADSEMSPRIRLTSSAYGIRADYENNGFTQATHDALAHKGVEGVKDNSVQIAKTNFKLDSYTLATANNLGDLVVDTLSDSTGIHSGSSSNYTYRGSSNYDVIVAPGGIDSSAKLVLHGNGTDASTTFTDSSSSTHTVTAQGNAQIDTAQSKFGGASMLFDGSGDYVSIPDSASWNFGSSNFTIDFWIRFNSVTACGIVAQRSSGDDNWVLEMSSTSNLKLRRTASGSGALDLNWSWSPSTNTWYHVAVVRGWSGNANDFAVTVDGTSLGAQTSSTTFADLSQVLAVGRDGGSGSSHLNGWIDEMRISTGTARWTANFTPPSAEYSSSGGTATVISNAYTVGSAPSEAMVLADSTLGTGSITYSVSRDNGTTWTACTPETVTNISSQPSGTQVKWKTVINGDAELNAIAVAL